MDVKKINIFSACFLIMFSILFLSAYKPDSIDNIINNSQLSEKSIISVSVREAQSEKIIYQRNANFLLHPASTMKAFSTPVVLSILGANYKISTGIYKDSKGKIYLKLSGDPMLTTDELSNLFAAFRAKGYSSINDSLYIDDKAIDDVPWGIGWMWDDENNPYMPKFNAYNINRNLINVKVTPTALNQKPKVSITPYYPVIIINNAVASKQDNISAERKIWRNTETIYVEGKIASAKEITLPVGNPENFFKFQLSKAIKGNNIKFSGSCKKASVPKDAVLIAEISHKLIDEIKVTNKNSDNLAAEILFKIAGAKYAGGAGTTENGLKAFNSFYSGLGADTSELSIVDASGVSHNDLITANWMSLALSKLYKTSNFQTYKSTLATPCEKGTLQNRLVDLKGRFYGKTGTNAGISAVTGYLTADSGKVYAFSILIQNFKGGSKPAKELEDKIIKSIYLN